MAAVASAPAPLDRLSSELNNVFFQVGKIFKNAHQGDSKALNQAKTKAKDGIPQAQDRFQEALDELEKDLTQARTVLNRDLTALRNKRAEREMAAGAARLQNGQAKGVKADSNAGAATARNNANSKKAFKANSEAKQSLTEAKGSSAEAAPVVAAADSMSNDIDSMFNDDMGDLAGLDALTAPANDQTGAAVGDDQMNTDSLFGDSSMALEGADFTNLGGSNQDDLSALLPGLEKYANQSQDGTGANDGQDTNDGGQDFDLEALLGDLTGGAGAAQGQPQAQRPVQTATAADAKTSSAEGKESQTAATAADNDAATAAGNSTADVGATDFSNENTFDIDFDDLTGGAGDATALGSNPDLNDWFNFD